LLERLLEWLAALGTSVVVLSATLPQVKRNALVAAFQQGLGQTPGAAAHQAYPRITWVDGAGRSGAIHATPAPELRRVIGFEAMEGTADVIAAALSHALSGGGCAAVICNTVARAQEIYEALIPYFPGEADDGFPVLDMLHARFPYDERQVREQRVLSRFGRPLNNPKGHTRPNRAVLVSTQVIEQSLDIDFDLMASDFAPVDLLLQRAGRLWRHERGVRPVPGPQLWVMGGTGSPDEVPVFPEGTSFVYDPHVLLRSWLALNGRFQLSLPTDLEPLIESVYGHAEEPQGLSDTLGEHWRTTSLLLDRRLNVATGEAARRRLGPPYSEGELWTLTSDIYEEDSPDLHPELQALTRLTEPSVQVIPLYGSPDKPLIDPGGHAVGPLNRPPSAADIEALMRRSFSVASSRLVFALRDQPIPGWQRSTLLRHHRVLWLQDDHTWQSDPSVRMAADLGLVVPRTGRGVQESDG
jgi:CRISPR-associated endonuclease/helicase Cas3